MFYKIFLLALILMMLFGINIQQCIFMFRRLLIFWGESLHFLLKALLMQNIINSYLFKLGKIFIENLSSFIGTAAAIKQS